MPRSRSNAAELERWLEPIGLGHRAEAFRAQGIRPEHLPELSDGDLRELGLTIGERKEYERFRRSIGRSDAPRVLPERRPLTIVFVDLADSVTLSERLDLEDLLDVLHAYRAFCDGIIEKYGGRVAQYYGDGILAYFCYPLAHENDAERAVRAALEIVEGVADLATPAGCPLEVRIGVATGRVVVSNLFNGQTLDAQSVNGATSNMAARLQAMAPPNGVILSELTHERVGTMFVTDDLGPTVLRGFSAEQHVFRALQVRTDNAAHLSSAVRLTPMFARDYELGLLQLAWYAAAGGDGGSVLVAGEAGIGKSRLVERFVGTLEPTATGLIRINCSPFDQDSLFRPVLAHVRLAAAFEPGDEPDTRLRKLGAHMRGSHQAEDLAVIADLLQMRSDPDLEGMNPALLRERGLEALCRQFIAQSEERPLCIVVEDLHWIDPTSEALVSRLALEARGRRLLLVLTSRGALPASPTAETPGTTPAIRRIGLQRLHAGDVAAMVQSLFGDEPVPRSVIQQIASKTDGLPLFVEEYVRPLLGAGASLDWSRVAAAEDAVAVPASLQDSLMAHLDRSGTAKEVAQIASVIGRVARLDVLTAVAGLAPGALEAALATLRDTGLMYAHAEDGRECCAFSHALVREAAYESLLREPKRSLHSRVARAMVALDPDGVELQPELLALHLTEGGLAQEAVEYWYKAGQRAVRRSALLEAARLLRRGLEAVEQIADKAMRDERSLQFRALLGPALLALRGPGSAEVQEIYVDAYEAAADREDTPWHFPLAWGWWRTSRDYIVRGKRADTLLTRARLRCTPDLELQAHHCNWAAQFVLGKLDRCVHHAKEGLRIYAEGEYGHHASLYGNHDACVCAHGELAQVYWMQGRLTEALAEDAESRRRGFAAQHIGSRIHAMDMALLMQTYRRDHAGVAALAGELGAFAGEHGLSDHRAKAEIFRGWAAAMTGDKADGIAVLQQGLVRQREIGTLEDFPFYLTMLAEALVRHGRADEAVSGLTHARAEFDRIGIRVGMPEVLRNLGVAMLAADPAGVDAAAQVFDEAAAASAEQGTAMYGLRVALEVARLAQQGGDARQARQALRAALDAAPDAGSTDDHAAAAALLGRLAAK